MTDNEIIIAVAKLDGWEEVLNESAWVNLMPHLSHKKFWRGQVEQRLSKYLDSRDAIIPVIEKQNLTLDQQRVFYYEVGLRWELVADCNYGKLLFATPRQLSIALLKATGNWKD